MSTANRACSLIANVTRTREIAQWASVMVAWSMLVGVPTDSERLKCRLMVSSSCKSSSQHFNPRSVFSSDGGLTWRMSSPWRNGILSVCHSRQRFQRKCAKAFLKPHTHGKKPCCRSDVLEVNVFRCSWPAVKTSHPLPQEGRQHCRELTTSLHMQWSSVEDSRTFPHDETLQPIREVEWVGDFVGSVQSSLVMWQVVHRTAPSREMMWQL